jgi:hypothetical protein
MRLFLLFALLPLLSYGQGTERIRRGYAAQPELQAELQTTHRNYVYLAVGGLRYSDYNDVVTNRTLGLDVRYLAAGYEQQFANDAWSWGATARLAGAAGSYTVFQPGLLLRHRSALGPLSFGQRLGAEYALADGTRLNPAYDLLPTYYAASPLLVRLRLDLQPESDIRLGDAVAMSPRLGFEPALFLRLQKAASDPDKRTIDFTSLRGELAFSFAKGRLVATPWYALQTQYLRTLIQTDQYGNPTSNGRLNVLLPTVGLEVRYCITNIIHVEEGHFSLPTQH